MQLWHNTFWALDGCLHDCFFAFVTHVSAICFLHLVVTLILYVVFPSYMPSFGEKDESKFKCVALRCISVIRLCPSLKLNSD